jgi:hypothetical protein
VPILIGGGYMLGFIRKRMGLVDVSGQDENEGLKILAGTIEQYRLMINVILQNGTEWQQMLLVQVMIIGGVSGVLFGTYISDKIEERRNKSGI